MSVLSVHLLYFLYSTLQVQAQVQKPSPRTPPVRTRQWVFWLWLVRLTTCFTVHEITMGIWINWWGKKTVVCYFRVSVYSAVVWYSTTFLFIHQMAHINNQQWRLDCFNWQPHSQDSARVNITNSAESSHTSCHLVNNFHGHIFFVCNKYICKYTHCGLHTSVSDWLWLLFRPPTAWTLHPPVVPSAPVKVETVEKKIPKGVPLQFDINSVGKPVRACYTDFYLVKYS